MKIAIIGGIGSGKSFVCDKIKDYGFEIYNCDNAAKRLIMSSQTIHRSLSSLIGKDIYANGILDKEAIRTYIMSSDANAARIDGIVHPAVAKDFISSGLEWMECAILYESGFDKLVDKVILVSAPDDIRISRVMQRDHLTRNAVEGMMARQMSQEEQRKRCDYEIINDGTTDIDSQITKIINKLNL
jgi:dephospho-CoA kinase